MDEIKTTIEELEKARAEISELLTSELTTDYRIMMIIRKMIKCIILISQALSMLAEINKES